MPKIVQIGAGILKKLALKCGGFASFYKRKSELLIFSLGGATCVMNLSNVDLSDCSEL